MAPSLSVIIPVYRDWDRLSACLSALEKQTLPAESFEIIVANNEPEGRRSELELPGNARIVDEPRPGSYAARNTAVMASRGRYLAFTDSDCIPDPLWLESGLAVLERDPQVRVTGPISVFAEPGSGRYAHLYEFYAAFPQKQFMAEGITVTANLMVARDVFDRVGPFEERMSGGDWDWNKRAQSMDIPLVFDEAVTVQHPARRNMKEIFVRRRRIAGSIATNADRSAARYILGRLKPPRPRALPFDRASVGWRNWGVLYLIAWAKGLVEAQEFALVRMGIKRPSRA